MHISLLHKLIISIMAISLTPQGVLATVTPENMKSATQYHQEWLSVDNIEKRQGYDVDRGELCKYLLDTYTEMTGKEPLAVEDIENPDIAATRAELALMLYNMIEKEYPEIIAKDETEIEFQEEVPEEYEKALSFAFSRGLIMKQGNGKIGANSNVTLGEMATTLNRTVAAAPQFKVINDNITEKRAYLTFDDGISANTTKILDILKKYNVKATFFVTGRGDPVILKRIIDEGHTIGNHTMSHKYQDIYASTDNFWEDFNEERDYLLDVLGDTSMYMRFPGGSNNSIGVRNKTVGDIQAQAKEKGYVYVDWNVDSGDAKANTVAKSKIVNNVLSGAKNKTDAIILMHQTKPKTTTVEALPEIIEGLENMGFELCGLEKSAYYPRFMK